MEAMNLSMEKVELVALLCFFIFLIKLVIRYWPKHDIKMVTHAGFSYQYSKNYGLFEAIFHVIKWFFRWTKIDSLELIKALGKVAKTKSRTVKKDNQIER